MRGYVQGSECRYMLGVFLDFVGAFDYLEWVRVIEKLESVGCELCGGAIGVHGWRE